MWSPGKAGALPEPDTSRPKRAWMLEPSQAAASPEEKVGDYWKKLSFHTDFLGAVKRVCCLHLHIETILGNGSAPLLLST